MTKWQVEAPLPRATSRPSSTAPIPPYSAYVLLHRGHMAVHQQAPVNHANPVKRVQPPTSRLNPLSFPCHREPIQRHFTRLDPTENHESHMDPAQKTFLLAAPPDASKFLLLPNPHTQESDRVKELARDDRLCISPRPMRSVLDSLVERGIIDLRCPVSRVWPAESGGGGRLILGLHAFLPSRMIAE